MLSGIKPFDSDNIHETLHKIKKGHHDMRYFMKNSHEVQDLINNMLRVDPEERFDAQKCLDHDWFKIIVDDKGKSDQ